MEGPESVGRSHGRLHERSVPNPSSVVQCRAHASGRDERRQILGRDADRVEDPNVRERAIGAEAVNGRRAQAELLGRLAHRQKSVLPALQDL